MQQQLPVDAIDVISGARTISPDRLEFLAINIKQVGLIHPISVYENAAVPGRYNVISGRTRLSAVKMLGWPVIDAQISALGEIEREMAELGENLCRTDYTPIEKAHATHRYAELLAAAVPGLKEHIESHTRMTLEQDGQKAAQEAAAQDLASQPSPIAAVAKRTGRSKRSVQADITRAKAFTDAEQTVLRDRGLSGSRIDQVRKLKDPDRLGVMNLLGAGMTFSGAMSDVLGDRYVDDGEDDDPIADDQFLADCSARNQSNKTRFDADALLYRKIQKARVAFAKAIGWGGTKTKIHELGLYGRRLSFLLDAKHPRDWIHCPQCVRGQIKGGVCNTCKGGGYQLG